MKKSHLSGIILILLVAILLLFIRSYKEKRAAFPYLLLKVEPLNKWYTDSPNYTNLVFQSFYDPKQPEGAWNLRYHGLHFNSSTDSVLYSSNYYSLEVQETSKKDLLQVKGMVVLGNNIINLEALRTFADKGNTSELAFVPCYSNSDTSKFKDYIVYQIRIPTDTYGKFKKIEADSLPARYRHLLKYDPAGKYSYFELNPCPPANVALSDSAVNLTQ